MLGDEQMGSGQGLLNGLQRVLEASTERLRTLVWWQSFVVEGEIWHVIQYFVKGTIQDCDNLQYMLHSSESLVHLSGPSCGCWSNARTVTSD